MRTAQKYRVLEYIKHFGSVSSLEGFQDLGIVSLPKRICELNELGYTFRKENTASLNRWGESVTFKRYYLVSEPEDKAA